MVVVARASIRKKSDKLDTKVEIGRSTWGTDGHRLGDRRTVANA